MVLEQVPGLEEGVNAIWAELAALVGSIYETAPRQSLQVLLTLAANDFRDLLIDLAEGRGRPAMHSARALFESMVALPDVIANQDESADRYEAHAAVTHQQIAAMDAGLWHLQGNELKAERFRRDKSARGSRRTAEEAINMWGSGFRSKWTPSPLVDRANRLGFSADYDFYRVASAPLHANSGGVFGLHLEIDGAPVYRLGSALLPCVWAFSEGLRFFRRFISDLTDAVGVDRTRFIEEFTRFEGLLPTYDRGVRELDGGLWPAVQPVGNVVILALLPSGARQWLLHDNQAGKVVPCEQPADIGEEQLTTMTELLDRAEELGGASPEEWVTVAALGSRSAPLPDAAWRSDVHLVPAAWLPGGGIRLPWDQG